MKKKQESKISLKDNIRFTIVFLVMVLSLVGFYIEGKYGDNKKDGYIMHALGGMDDDYKRIENSKIISSMLFGNRFKSDQTLYEYLIEFLLVFFFFL